MIKKASLLTTACPSSENSVAFNRFTPSNLAKVVVLMIIRISNKDYKKGACLPKPNKLMMNKIK
jgi:hypothetical protein